jgi:hypothetical protein
MANGSRYIIFAHRDERSVFGAATNPVIRNGALLAFEDEAGAHDECDRLNARPRNPHVRYSIKPAGSVQAPSTRTEAAGLRFREAEEGVSR